MICNQEISLLEETQTLKVFSTGDKISIFAYQNSDTINKISKYTAIAVLPFSPILSGIINAGVEALNTTIGKPQNIIEENNMSSPYGVQTKDDTGNTVSQNNDTKPWYQSKTIMASIIGIILIPLVTFHLIPQNMVDPTSLAGNVVDAIACLIPIITLFGRIFAKKQVTATK